MVTSDNRTDFDDKVQQLLNGGWNVIQGTMYATVITVTDHALIRAMKALNDWESNIFSIFLQGKGAQVIITATTQSAFDSSVNSHLEAGRSVIPGTIYAATLNRDITMNLVPYISVVLQKD